MIRKLTELDLSDGTSGSMSVCVVSSEFNGPVKNGGIGTATSGLIRQLVADGHKVTFLYTLVEYGKPQSGDKPWQHWVDALTTDGITLKHIPHEGDYRSWQEKSWRVKEFISENEFDVVYFNEHHGSGYYSLLAKRAGVLPFAKQLHCVICHGSMEWVFDINDQFMRSSADLEMMGVERRSVEMADVVIGPSSYLLGQYQSYGWRLPARTFVQPYPLFRKSPNVGNDNRIPIHELVFFGRLETRKGLWIFCEAIDRIAQQLSGKTVTFLGKVTYTSGLSSGFQIINRSSNWPCQVNLFTDFDQEEAVGYLKNAGRLAVMPSLADNSPCVIYECMEEGIPFVTGLGSGADELIDPSCWKDVMVEPTADTLAQKLKDIVDRGASLGRPRFVARDNLATWSDWHRYVAKNRSQLIESSSTLLPVSSSGLGPTQSTTPLIVIIDNGICTLSLLIDNLTLHIKRFSGRAVYLVLTSRQGELQGALLELFSSSPVPVSILDSTMVAQARALIFASTTVFFIGAEFELQPPFLILAINLLAQQPPALVSCAVAVRRDVEKTPEIKMLPSGDIPGLAGLGYPIGGAAWAMAAKDLAKEFENIELYDKQQDEFVSSSALGEIVLQRGSAANVPIHILPIVGAIETGNGAEGTGRDRAQGYIRRFKDIKDSAQTFGIAQSMYSGSAPWFAMSAFGAQGEEQSGIFADDLTDLPPQHPLISVQNSGGQADVAVLAAAMGRPELALQLESHKGISVERARHLIDLAVKSVRLRPALDLCESLRSGYIMEFGRNPLPEWTASGKKGGAGRSKAASPEHHLGAATPNKSVQASAGQNADDTSRTHINRGVGRAFIDSRRINARQNKIKAISDLPEEEPGILFFIDVPLRGNSSLTIRVRCSGSEPTSIRVKIIDQRNGAEMATKSINMQPRTESVDQIPLHAIYATAAIVLEFIGGSKLEVALEELRVE